MVAGFCSGFNAVDDDEFVLTEEFPDEFDAQDSTEQSHMETATEHVVEPEDAMDERADDKPSEEVGTEDTPEKAVSAPQQPVSVGDSGHSTSTQPVTGSSVVKLKLNLGYTKYDYFILFFYFFFDLL